MPQILQEQERERLVEILMRLYDITDGSRSRRVFIQNTASLGRFIPGLNLASPSSRNFAWELVDRIEGFGQLPERPNYHSLGALLNAMLRLSDELNNEDASFIASLIFRYSLVTDPYYLETLSNQYHLTEQVIRKPPPEFISPRANVGRADNSPEFEAKIEREQDLESIINSTDNFLDIHLLEGALYCAQAVARIEIPPGKPHGTGFLVGSNLLLTNQHILKEKSYLEEAVARFGYVNDASEVASIGKVVKIKPDFYHTSPAQELDYALVRLEETPIKNVATGDELRDKSMAELSRMGKHQGYLVLAARSFLDHERINIIQHPDGKPLKAVLTQNYIIHRTALRVQYIADTMDGSSGAPVFNQRWEVVALHHSGNPYPSEPLSESLKKAIKGRFQVNEGIPMRAILDDFKSKGIDRYLPPR